MVYEFALAQTLSLLLGQTTLRYPITIGLYTASLGFGSLLFAGLFKNTKLTVMRLIKVEISIAIISCLAFVFLFLFDFIFKTQWFQTHLPIETMVMPIFTHLLVLLIGFLSGAELPLLMEIAEEHKTLSAIRVLSGDYFGTLLAAILFPLALLPNLHLFSIVVLATFLNLLSAICLYYFFIEKEARLNSVLLFIWPSIGMLLLLCFQGLF
jgi:spermidine synthase